MLATFAGGWIVVLLLIVAANPYGNLPVSLFSGHAIMDTNQRYQYPAVAKSGLFDSVVIGTSSVRLLHPRALAATYSGRFANLAMDGATAWEQMRLAALFARHAKRPGTLVLGLDHAWCLPDSDRERITTRGFPEWMYDGNPWRGLPHMLNGRTVEIAGRRLLNGLGLKPVRIPFDGYEVFVPPDADYDMLKVRRNLGARSSPNDVPMSDAERHALPFPVFRYLDDILRLEWARVVLLFPPVHINFLPVRQSAAAHRDTECKRRVVTLAAGYGAAVVDFRFPSSITESDDNFWDPLHFRVGIARRIVEGLRQAAIDGADDPAGTFRVLGRP